MMIQMGYLICNKCLGYYELQEGESPDDFVVCNCQGKLHYYNSLDEFRRELIYSNKIKEKQLMNIKESNHMK